MLPLTEKQKEIYCWMLDYLDEHEYPPTYREVQLAFDIRNITTVVGHLKALEKKRYIQRTRGVSRGIRFLRVVSSCAVV